MGQVLSGSARAPEPLLAHHENLQLPLDLLCTGGSSSAKRSEPVMYAHALFLMGFKTLMTTSFWFARSTPSKTSEYFPMGVDSASRRASKFNVLTSTKLPSDLVLVLRAV